MITGMVSKKKGLALMYSSQAAIILFWCVEEVDRLTSTCRGDGFARNDGSIATLRQQLQHSAVMNSCTRYACRLQLLGRNHKGVI